MRRRRSGPLTLGVVAILFAVAACSAGQGGAGASGNDKVEVVAEWLGSGAEQAYNSMIDDFRRRNPGIEFVGDGTGSDIQQVLATRFEAGDPPDSYQARVGRELLDDVKAGRLADLSGLYDSQGWRDMFPRALLDQVSVSGKPYAVPVNIHRANLLWFNPKTLARAGISTPPATWTDLRIQAGKLRDLGITPIAVGPGWTRKQLLETILLGELGPGTYAGLWDGTTDWNAPQVKEALLTAVLVFSESDATSPASDWQAALNRVTTGAAAYVVMGDWAYDQNIRSGLKYKTDFDVAPTPGSVGVYDFAADSFTMAKAAPHPGAARQWLIECGSVEGQNILNPVLGTVSARLDADVSHYAQFQSDSLADWRSAKTKVVGSMTFGVLVGRGFGAAVDAALTELIDDHDADRFAEAMIKAYEAAK
jgi:glucose/mannose transport system substrate-binding protein